MRGARVKLEGQREQEEAPGALNRPGRQGLQEVALAGLKLPGGQRLHREEVVEEEPEKEGALPAGQEEEPLPATRSS